MKTSAYEQVLLGSLLGDGCLCYYERNANPRYVECHSVKQLAYLKWKNRFFKSKIKKKITYLKKTDKTYLGYYFRTKPDPSFTPYYNLFYKNGKKKVSDAILKKLRPMGIAVWFCDDGSYSYDNNNLKIATGSFDKRIISRYFESRFNINFKLQEEYIYLSADDSKKFIKLIKKHVPKCMYYKLGTNLRKKESCREKNRNRCKSYAEEKKKDPEYMERKRAGIRAYMRKLRSDPVYREIHKRKDREYKKKRYHNDPDYREKTLARGRSYYKRRYHNDPDFREKEKIRIKSYRI